MKLIMICVDDEKVILDSLKAQLKAAFGNVYSYELAENGDDALELIEELDEAGQAENIVVIVSDWLMPGMKGDELLIKIHQRFPRVIKFLLTGQADEDAIQRAIAQANLHKCLRKPWSEDELINSIRSAIAEMMVA
jgi:CheY-like chemotaxis protein